MGVLCIRINTTDLTFHFAHTQKMNLEEKQGEKI